VVKHIYRSKPPTLDFWFRSGSINRDRLVVVKELLSAEGFDLKVSFTSKRELLRRLVVRSPIDGTVAVSGINLLRSTSSTLDLSWPTPIAVGYAQGTEVPGLPGTLSFRSPAT